MRIGIEGLEKANLVLNDPSILPNTLDDGLTGEQTIEPALRCDSIYVLMPTDYSVFILIPMNQTTYDFHPYVKGDHRGPGTYDLFQRVYDYIFSETPCKKLVARIPTCFPKVKAHSEKTGFKEEGFLTDAIQRGGVMYGQWVVSLNKEWWLNRR